MGSIGDDIMEYRFRVWLSNEDKKIFGEGPFRLLKKVEELGSLRLASISMNMSYSKAWKILRNIEEEMSILVLERAVGGENGGGSKITEEAKQLMNKYEMLKLNIEKAIENSI